MLNGSYKLQKASEVKGIQACKPQKAKLRTTSNDKMWTAAK